MQGENKERWRELCEKASTERNPKVMLELIRQINDLLEAKKRRIEQEASPDEPPK
jgi:hypothetical protein